ncbi:hypothetical protein ACFE04_003303 [Oxalis oulophora]
MWQLQIVNEWESKKPWIPKKKIDEVRSNVVEPALQSCATIHEQEKLGSVIKRLLSNKFELDKTLNTTLEIVPRDRSWKFSKQYLQVALDFVGPSAGLPPNDAVEQVDKVIAKILIVTNDVETKDFVAEVGEESLPKIYGGLAKLTSLQDVTLPPLES